eukprot:1331937-Pleurochrysis_carterae.AAC.2
MEAYYCILFKSEDEHPRSCVLPSDEAKANVHCISLFTTARRELDFVVCNVRPHCLSLMLIRPVGCRATESLWLSAVSSMQLSPHRHLDLTEGLISAAIHRLQLFASLADGLHSAVAAAGLLAAHASHRERFPSP